MITEKMLNKTLQECLEAFEGAPKDGVHTLEGQFELLAKKMLYGGHFEVWDNSRNILLRSVFLHTVEFYYHEENGIEKDLIVYHRNKGNKKPRPFPIGSLHTHVSGIDITFEAPDASYRASALVRAFQVKNGTEEKYAEIENPQKKNNPIVEYRSTYLYNYLFMDTAISNGITVKWVPDSRPVEGFYQGLRKNVEQFGPHEKKNGKQDTRPWAFSIEEFEDKLQYHPE